MKQEDPEQAEAASSDGIEEILGTIQEQGRLTLKLLRTIVALLLPKEGAREGPTLEELLAKIVSQQQQLILIGQTTQAGLEHLAQTLPDAVAEALDVRRNGTAAPHA